MGYRSTPHPQSLATKINWIHSGREEYCHVQLKWFCQRPALRHPHWKQLISILPLGWRFDVHSNQNKTEANFRFTYEIDFHVQLVRLLLVLLVACTRFRCGWKIQVSTIRRWRLLKWSLRQRDASMLSRWWLFSWMSSCLCLTTLMTRRWSLFTLLQMAASICWLVACLIEWKKECFLMIRNKLWISFLLFGGEKNGQKFMLFQFVFFTCVCVNIQMHTIFLRQLDEWTFFFYNKRL